MGKRLVAIGDSITHGTCLSEPWGLVENNFINLTAEALGFTEVINYGTNGTTISSLTDWRPTLAMCVYVDEMFPGDLAIIAGGTNDYGRSVVLGSVEDREDVSFFGALDVLYRKVQKKYGNNVYVITPISRQKESKNSKGYTLDDYRNAIKIKAKEYGFKVIDGKNVKIDPFDEKQRQKYIPDGLHPNEAGHKVYADYVIEEIKKHENRNI